MFKLYKLKLKMKYYTFHYERFYKMGVVSEYYKTKLKLVKKEIKKLEKQSGIF